MKTRTFHWRTAGKDIEVHLDESADQKSLRIGDREFPFSVKERETNSGAIEINGRTVPFFAHRKRRELSIWIDGHTYRLEAVENTGGAEHASANSGEVRAQMPGKVLRIDVRVGDAVAERQTLVIMESMKMESSLVAAKAGTITAVHCEPGQTVDMGDLLLEIQ